ncbi:MAG TPA: hypothetical protein VN667_21735 [Burkholderiales bacterium]|nr:hypothetical protein [Burkholderiales bacterium]
MLGELQNLLAGIYDIPPADPVEDFLVTERSRLPAAARASPADEQVFVAERGGDLCITLFLDSALLERLAAADPLDSLHSGNLADFWVALEGVSHFVCLAWHAAFDQPVTLLELEMQGEIDKYIVSLWLLRRQNADRFPSELYPVLFEHTSIDPERAAGRVEMYRQASAYAARYCRWLAAVLRSSERASRAAGMAELRRFYRLTRPQKFRRIHAMA